MELSRHALEEQHRRNNNLSLNLTTETLLPTTQQEILAGRNPDAAREDGAKMTKKVIRKICQESGLYQRPDLNTKLYLHRRGFRKIENLDEYTEVQALWLGGNGIQKLENLHPLSKLKCLFLAQNGLTCIENLEGCPDLVMLDLSENSICRIEGLEKLKKLSSFKIARNKLVSLSDIWALRECPSLTNVDLSYNALCLQEEEAGIRGVSKPPVNSCSTLTAAENRDSLGERHQQHENSGNQPILGGYQVEMENSEQDESSVESAAQASYGPTTTDLPALRYLDDCPVKEEDHEAALAWFRGGWKEEQKVIKAHKEREQEILRGHVSTLRRLQEAHRQKIKLALERISEEAEGRQKTGTSKQNHMAGEQRPEISGKWLTSSGREQASGLNEQPDEGTVAQLGMTSQKPDSCGLVSPLPSETGTTMPSPHDLVHP